MYSCLEAPYDDSWSFHETASIALVIYSVCICSIASGLVPTVAEYTFLY